MGKFWQCQIVEEWKYPVQKKKKKVYPDQHGETGRSPLKATEFQHDLCLFLREKLRSVFAKITQRVHIGTQARRCRCSNEHCVLEMSHLLRLTFPFLLQPLSAATATSLTSRTATSPPPTRSMVLELWFSSPATPATLWSRAPLSSSASAPGIPTGMTRSLFAKVSLTWYRRVDRSQVQRATADGKIGKSDRTAADPSENG